MSFNRRRVAAGMAAAITSMLFWVPDARAQVGTPAGPLTAGWQDGFFVQTANGDYRLQLSLLVQADERVAVDDPQNAIIDAFTMRRLRPILQGRVAKLFEFYFVPDLAGGAVNIRDAYIDTRLTPSFRVRVGKGKTPIGLERLQPVAHILFVERALPTAVAPDRDVGIQVIGDLAGGMVSYDAGVFNGVADGASADVETNDGKDVAGRVVVRPFKRRVSSRAAGLGFAIAGSRGEQGTTLPSFRTSGLQTFFSYDHNAAGEGVRRRVSPQLFYYRKSVGVFGEYVHSSGTVAKGTTSADIVHQSLVVAGSYLITGEAASERGVRPARVFDPARGSWGALQMTARYHALAVDRDAVSLGLAAVGSSHDAKAFTIGVNWYLNPFIKWVVNFERTVFDGDRNGPRQAENVMLVRNQIAF